MTRPKHEEHKIMKAAEIAALLGALALAGCATPAERDALRQGPAPVVARDQSASVPAVEAPRVAGQVDALPARPAGSPEAERVPGRATPVPPPAETGVSSEIAPEAPKVEQPKVEQPRIDARPESSAARATPAPAVPKAPKAAATVSAKPPAKVASTPAETEPARKSAPAPAPNPPKTAAPTLDLKDLEARLRDTDAIGVMTKLTLKSQVDDLLERFRDYHEGRAKMQLAELRQPYDSLILKVLALLQDKDPPLAGAIAASRETIWSILADGARFSKL